MALAMIL